MQEPLFLSLRTIVKRKRGNERFQSQHYNPMSSANTLAATLVNPPILWPYINIAQLESTQLDKWIRDNAARDNFYLYSKNNNVFKELERFLRERPVPFLKAGRSTSFFIVYRAQLGGLFIPY